MPLVHAVQQVDGFGHQLALIDSPEILSIAAIDNVWKRVAKAVVSGKLGFAAKVNAHDPEDNTHVICVYTEDFTNEEHVRKVEESLRKEGVKGRMTDKPDIYTTLGIYRDNPWRLRPTVYSSHH
ncbi:UPF0696 protein C11orf68 homolog [Stylophora pistillata]|uniref:UPF0696 protein C11orf68 n=1 Tax=Stylophora pistillata TaxID=50429 RepID=A0A2B4R4R3_STYPI|nr:UPF0696 protein C11orf68 homolog [Stylophora pistillata]PFX11295.1 UPF0696 protein C11orf68 [Stylophora pistillata]